MSIAEEIEYRSGQQFGVGENIGDEDAVFGFRLAASGCEARERNEISDLVARRYLSS